MAKKLTRKEKIALQQQEAASNKGPVAKKINPRQAKASSKLNIYLGFIIAALAFLLYANTLDHEFALDDYSLIKENTMTRKGSAAIGEILHSTYRAGYFNTDAQLYRPLSKVFFALEWEYAGKDALGAAHLGHWVNVLMYALTGFLLFYVLSLYLKGNYIVSFLTASLFIAHPIHTEVTANIKSLDEILCFLMFVVTLLFTYRYLQKNAPLDLGLAMASFFLALLSKESAITFLAVIPLTLWFFTDAETKKNLTVTGSLAVMAIIFLAIRHSVIGPNGGGETSVVDNLLAPLDPAHRFATAVMIMGMYLKLFFFPHPLVSDYSFRQIPEIGFADWRFLLSFAVYAALGVYAIMKFKKKDPIAFAIFYFFITASVASNIVIIIGTSFGERLMYTPSFGFCLAIAVLLSRAFKVAEESSIVNSVSAFFNRYSRTLGISALILILFAFKTVTRNPDWHDNLTLYTVDVKNSPNSSRTHFYLGNYMSQDDFLKTCKDDAERKMYLDSALNELNRSIAIYSGFADAYQQIGKVYLNRKDYVKADEYYKKAIGINPQTPIYHSNYGNVLFNLGRYDDARSEFQEAIKWNPNYADAYNNLASVYGTFGENLMKQGNKPEAMKNYQLAIDNFKKAVEIDPEFVSPLNFIAITYRAMGDEASAQSYFQKYNELMKAKEGNVKH